jgi:predicted amidohydrolase YtcJ
MPVYRTEGATGGSVFFVNARVLTMNPARPVAGSVTVCGGRIVALDGPAPAGVPIVDCGDSVLIPGFVDSHVHLLAAAAAARSVDCSPAVVGSIGDIQRLLAEVAPERPEGWIRATGYDEFALAEGRHPTRWDLDEAVPDRPICLRHRSGHAVVFNSLGLACAGISIESEEPPGGVIDRRTDDGEPTGLLIDMDAVVDRAIPPLGFDELVGGMRRFNDDCIRAGVTAVQDMTHRNDDERLSLMRRVTRAAGFLPRLLPPATRPGVAGDGPVKLMLPEATGLSAAGRRELVDSVVEAHRSGRQIAIHAVTAESVERALDALASALRQYPREGHRHRIEHAAVCPPRLSERIAELGVVVVSNPGFLVEGAARYRATVAGSELPQLYATGSLERAGVVTAAGSDAPVSRPDPLGAIEAATARRGRDGTRLPGVGSSPHHALSMVTRAGAFAARSDAQMGVVAPGMAADLVLLDRVPGEGTSAAVRSVWIDGVKVHSSVEPG